MKSTIALSVLALAACEPDLNLDHWGPEVDVFDDGSTLYIVGCADETLLGCNPALADERMTLVVGASSIEVAPDVAPEEPVPAEAFLLLFDSGPFVAMVPREADSLRIELGGQQGELALPEAFTVRAPLTASRVHPIAVEFDRPADVQQVDVLDLVTCDDGSQTFLSYQPELATFTLDTTSLPAAATCEHEIRINARRQVIAGLQIDARRVEVITLTSTP